MSHEAATWRTGRDERTVQRAERRLEAAELMVRIGFTHRGTPRRNLDITLPCVRLAPSARSACPGTAQLLPPFSTTNRGATA